MAKEICKMDREVKLEATKTSKFFVHKFTHFLLAWEKLAVNNSFVTLIIVLIFSQIFYVVFQWKHSGENYS